MSALLKIRSERDQMSAIERRIGDFILENAYFLRDYSSQQLANVLKVSQSSVVKFSQKLGFKGYPDLKFSIGEAVARDGSAAPAQVPQAPESGSLAEAAADLWRSKMRAEEETRLINTPDEIREIASRLDRAGKVFLMGFGGDAVAARAFAMKLDLLGVCTVGRFDPVAMAGSLSTAEAGDVLLAFCEHGAQPSLCHVAREFRAMRGRVISVTRHTPNSLRANADAALLVSAHDERAQVRPLLYQAALQQLLDVLFLALCAGTGGRLERLKDSLERIAPVGA